MHLGAPAPEPPGELNIEGVFDDLLALGDEVLWEQPGDSGNLTEQMADLGVDLRVDVII